MNAAHLVPNESDWDSSLHNGASMTCSEASVGHLIHPEYGCLGPGR